MASIAIKKLNSAACLPPFLVVGDTGDQGRGVFTKKSIRRGKRIFASPPYSFGIGGITVENARAMCHYCLTKIRCGNPVVCSYCKVVGYCSRNCLAAALPLHKLECKGIAELEKLRGTPGRGHITSERDDLRRFWPPNQALMIARAINKKILQSERDNCLSIDDLAPPIIMPLQDKIAFNQLREYVRYLIPNNVDDDEIYQTHCRMTNNSASIQSPPDTSAVAIYLEYSLLNHMCRPNCGWEGENGNMSVFALQDIEPNSQLGISYLRFRYNVNLRKIRRQELKRAFGFDCGCTLCLEEEIVGSRCWLLDQKKRSLITPWSRKWADKVMKNGWEIICQSGSMENLAAIELLEVALKEQVVVLDKANIILILTAVFLLYKCSIVDEYRKGMSHFSTVDEEGMNALFEYGTMTEIEYVALDINACCSELGHVEESEEISDLMLKLFPKVPSADKMCDLDWEQGIKHDQVKTYSASTIKHLEDDMDTRTASREVITPQQVSACIARLCRKIGGEQ